MKSLALFGSTGSIGINTLDVVRRNRETFSIHALTTNGNVEILAAQAREFSPSVVCAGTPQAAEKLRSLIDPTIRVVHGVNGLQSIATDEPFDMLVSSLVGFAGVLPTLAAIRAGKNVALANKETLVAAGEVITRLVRESGATLVPIDSEHSAIQQSLAGESTDRVRRLILTASGGPFRGWNLEKLESVTLQQALQHPNWSMGQKITIDSATLMNKGLEVIEAHWLFSLPASAIDVVIHPQSIIHSMVEFVDGSVKAQLGMPDMRTPIQYALTFPDRAPLDCERLDWTQIRSLTFEDPDPVTFRCLDLAYQSLDAGGTAPACLNAANEIAVAAFLREEVGFLQIPEIIESTLQTIPNQPGREIETILEVDRAAREIAETAVAGIRDRRPAAYTTSSDHHNR